MATVFRTFLAGLMAALPLFLTVFVLAWLIDFLDQYIGPRSAFGNFLSSLGMGRTTHEIAPYLIGIFAILAGVYILGLIVSSSLGAWIAGLFDGLLRRIPVFSNLYDMAGRLVAMLDGRKGPTIQDMKPAWCFFGGKPGAAVLALMPTTKTVDLGGEKFLAVLIPSAPVPFGGALIYVPEAWIEPAPDGVDDLISVYVSMGLQAPSALSRTP